jgi:hypothetical protein
MNATFETIRKSLKKYNAEENEAPPKIVAAGLNDFLDIQQKRKRNSQFVIGIKEFPVSETYLIEKLLDELERTSGQRPLAFLYDDRQSVEVVVKDFEDYYTTHLGSDLFQRIGSDSKDHEFQFYLIIVVLENHYFVS